MKNKIFKYDFLIIGAGLIGALTALKLHQMKLKVLVIDNKLDIPVDHRTLAVNANSKDFLIQLGIWKMIKTKPQSIKKIIIKDYLNSKPLTFYNKKEIMGNVIYNTELLKIARKKLERLQILKTNIDIKLETLSPNQTLIFKNKHYSFKKIILSIGKKVTSNFRHKSVIFNNGDYSYVGFFKHKKEHNSVAYENFNKEGPLAILPSPDISNKKSTFIYSTRVNTTNAKIKKIIMNSFYKSHGPIIFDKKIQKFPIIPHLIKYNQNFIYIGDSLKSIHPVAGQGWNLGVKDIQTLADLIVQYPLESKFFNSIYYSRRITESTLYFGFTFLINYLYENQSTLNNNLIKFGFQGLQKSSFLRNLFIKQAMGRINLVG